MRYLEKKNIIRTLFLFQSCFPFSSKLILNYINIIYLMQDGTLLNLI